MKKVKCSKCGKEVNVLELFTENRCLGCYEKDFNNLTEEEKKPVFDKSLINKKRVKELFEKNEVLNKKMEIEAEKEVKNGGVRYNS